MKKPTKKREEPVVLTADEWSEIASQVQAMINGLWCPNCDYTTEERLEYDMCQGILQKIGKHGELAHRRGTSGKRGN